MACFKNKIKNIFTFKFGDKIMSIHSDIKANSTQLDLLYLH